MKLQNENISVSKDTTKELKNPQNGIKYLQSIIRRQFLQLNNNKTNNLKNSQRI